MDLDAARTCLHKRFTYLLHRALTQGQAANGRTGLGPRTEAAIIQVAAEHPDATVDDIAAAYDAFHDEHRDPPVIDRPGEPPRR